MAVKKHLRGVGEKEQRMCEHTKKYAQRSTRCGRRTDEVTAHTVLKDHTPSNLLGLRWRQCHRHQARSIPVRWAPATKFTVRVMECADLHGKCNFARIVASRA